MNQRTPRRILQENFITPITPMNNNPFSANYSLQHLQSNLHLVTKCNQQIISQPKQTNQTLFTDYDDDSQTCYCDSVLCEHCLDTNMDSCPHHPSYVCSGFCEKKFICTVLGMILYMTQITLPTNSAELPRNWHAWMIHLLHCALCVNHQRQILQKLKNLITMP